MTDTNANEFLPGFSDVSPWYVVHCKSGREKYASEILHSNLGLTAYLPEKKIWNKGETRHVPLFPGYFFLQVDLQYTALSQINTSPGVLYLLAYAGFPQKVSSDFVEALSREIDRLNDTTVISFRPGDAVYVIDSPLSSLEAIFIGPATPGKRVQVLLNLLGRLTKTEVAVSALKKRTDENRVVNAAHLERERYTRGKGRKTRNHERSSFI